MNYPKVEDITILYLYETDDAWPNKSRKIHRYSLKSTWRRRGVIYVHI